MHHMSLYRDARGQHHLWLQTWASTRRHSPHKAEQGSLTYHAASPLPVQEHVKAAQLLLAAAMQGTRVIDTRGGVHPDELVAVAVQLDVDVVLLPLTFSLSNRAGSILCARRLDKGCRPGKFKPSR